MTGVGDVPRDFNEFMTWTRKNFTALERRQIPALAIGGRLGPNGAEITDWDLAVQYGWYYSLAGAANTPDLSPYASTGVFRGFVEAPDPVTGIIIQRVSSMTGWGPEYARTFDGAWSDWFPAAFLDGYAGVTADRTAQYGTPATLAARVALHNQCIQYQNVQTGLIEQYFTNSSDAGVLTPGLRSGNTPGWYPIAGQAIYASVRRAASMASSGGGAIVPFDTVDVAQHFPISLPASALTVPYGGDYEVSATAVAVQTAAGFLDLSLRRSTATFRSARSLVRPDTNTASRSDIPPVIQAFTTGQNVDLLTATSTASTISADTAQMTVKYLGPPIG